MSNITLHPRPPTSGNILDVKADKNVTRAFYTDKPDMSTRIHVDRFVKPDEKKPRLGETSLMEMMKQMMGGGKPMAGGKSITKEEKTKDGVKTTTVEAQPSNMDHRR